TNWNPANIPGATTGFGSGDTAIFANNTNTSVTDSYRNIKFLTFDTGAGAFTLSLGTLAITNAGAVTINAGVTNTETISTSVLLTSTANGTASFLNNSTTSGAD